MSTPFAFHIDINEPQVRKSTLNISPRENEYGCAAHA